MTRPISLVLAKTLAGELSLVGELAYEIPDGYTFSPEEWFKILTGGTVSRSWGEIKAVTLQVDWETALALVQTWNEYYELVR